MASLDSIDFSFFCFFFFFLRVLSRPKRKRDRTQFLERTAIGCLALPVQFAARRAFHGPVGIAQTKRANFFAVLISCTGNSVFLILKIISFAIRIHNVSHSKAGAVGSIALRRVEAAPAPEPQKIFNIIASARKPFRQNRNRPLKNRQNRLPKKIQI